ncbi:MAG: CotH kinase family protein [Bacteroidales bacterium]|nr:CotH kinase family protein [Bacteroidales bacterium]
MKHISIIASLLILAISGCTERTNADEEKDDINWTDLTITENDAVIDWTSLANTYIKSYEDTGLPVIYIDTPDGSDIDSSDEKIPTEGCSIKIVGADGVTQLEYICRTKARGNQSLTFPKKSYNIKFENKQSVLGMPKGKRWCLLANWGDKTALRNEVAFQLARMTDMAWTPRSEYAELVLNGVHLGLYQVVEAIRRNGSRVNISDDGVILELDSYYDEDYKFYSPKRSLPYNFKDPDDPTDEMFQEIQDYVAEFEECLYDVDRLTSGGYKDYIDVDSFIDYILVNEVCGNAEIKYPKSVFMYKDRDSLMYAGPVWDFDYGTFSSTYSNTLLAMKTTYFSFLMNDDGYRSRLKERWNTLKMEFEKVLPMLDEKADEIHPSQVINAEMWPIEQWDVNGEEQMTYVEAVETLKLNLIRKIVWLDLYIKLM